VERAVAVLTVNFDMLHRGAPSSCRDPDAAEGLMEKEDAVSPVVCLLAQRVKRRWNAGPLASFEHPPHPATKCCV
jgi:hypothetical protein